MKTLAWTPHAWEEYLYWQATDRKMLGRINELIKDVLRTPFAGIGKPESLKFDLAGMWSRRINAEHRLVYQVRGDAVVIVQCRYHY
ncbi:MAG: Txe/YoeB family addiction module toxin [Solidesulfovibrio sp.]